MDIIIEKMDELKYLLIGKSLIEQKEIIINFLFKNKEINKHFKCLYKAMKGIFEKNSLSDFIIQEIINKTLKTLHKFSHFLIFKSNYK